MKEQKPAIIYYGNDSDYFNELKRNVVISLKDQVELVQLSYDEENLSQVISEYSVFLVFIDFSSGIKSNTILVEMSFFKTLEAYQTILFVGVYAKEEDLSLNLNPVASGISLVQIKGEEEWLVISEALSIAFSLPRDNLNFAKAKDLSAKMNIYSLGVLDSLTSDFIKIQTDICFMDDLNNEIMLKTDMYEYEGDKCYLIESCLESVCHEPFFYNYKLSYPYAGAWDEEGERELHQDTVETWISLNSEDLISKNTSIIFTTSRDFLLSFSNILSSKSITYLYDYELDVSTFLDILQSLDPRVIYFDFNDEYFSYDFFDVVTKEIVDSGSEVVIIAFNIPSGSAALQKMYGYSNILSVKNGLNLKLYKDFNQMFEAKIDLDETRALSLVHNDPRKVVFIKNEVILLSVSEHEVIFKAPFRLPLFCTLKIDLPVEALLTVTDEEEGEEGNIYTTIIHGISFQTRETLRRVVNQFIYNPPSEISSEVLGKVLSSVRDKPSPVIEDKKTLEAEHENNTDKPQSKGIKLKREKKSSHSKL